MAHIRITHVLRSPYEPRNRDVNLLQKIPLLILENGNVEQHDPPHPRVMIRRRHGLQPPTAMPCRGNPLHINLPVRRRPAGHSPVHRVPHVGYLRLAASSSWWTVRCNDVSVARDLHEKVLVLRAIRLARTVAPRNKRHADVRRRDGCVNGVVWEGRVGGHGRRVGA